MADLLDQLELLEWLPGETLFSLVSRLHRFWGHSLAGHTCDALFGHPQQGSQHDLPGRLSTFVTRTNSRYGVQSELSMTHTVLAFYRPFLAEGVMDSAVRAMSSNSVAHLKMKLGILTSRFGANHPLKACPQCVREDVIKHGWSYWHLEHQYPGVWVCRVHERWLQVSSLKATGVGRFQWVLPCQADLRGNDDPTGQDATSKGGSALGMAELISALVGHGSLYPMDTLQRAYIRRLSEMGYVRSSGSFRWRDIGQSYAQYIRSLHGCADVPVEMADPDRAIVQLGRMLRGTRCGTHPLRQLLIIHWLFGDASRLTDAIASLEASALTKGGAHDDAGPCISVVQKPVGRRQRLEALMISGEHTISSAAQHLGVDVATAMVWATMMGMVVARRPKLLRDDVRTHAIALLRAGADKSDVGRQVGVSIQTVTRLLFTEVDLHRQWKDARYQLKCRESRAIWLSLVDTCGAAGIKILRAMEPAVHAWLYRNDHDWLVTHKPSPLSRRATGRIVRIDWDARDQVLSDQVRRTADQLSRQNPGARIKLWQIYQELPELKAKLGAIERLPLTRGALESVIVAKHKPVTGGLLEQ
jgi:Tn7-like transposition protein D/TniQ